MTGNKPLEYLSFHRTKLFCCKDQTCSLRLYSALSKWMQITLQRTRHSSVHHTLWDLVSVHSPCRAHTHTHLHISWEYGWTLTKMHANTGTVYFHTISHKKRVAHYKQKNACAHSHTHTHIYNSPAPTLSHVMSSSHTHTLRCSIPLSLPRQNESGEAAASHLQMGSGLSEDFQ